MPLHIGATFPNTGISNPGTFRAPAIASLRGNLQSANNVRDECPGA